ncbi:microtubule-associated protein 1A-like isoform X7 [Saccostrea cucullata]|uniref:microtubule-associated protein 1A-like isoform X7 n=1 Tax=Saccostrea cuccullata TaxID=36930 RepID=UPI002ED49FDD
MSLDQISLNSFLPLLVESLFLSSSVAVILIDWNYSFLEMSLLRMLQSYLPLWRRRNIRQDVYICLVITALAIMYNNCMKNFAINSENCRIALTVIVVLLSFWLQSKRNKKNVSDKCVGTSNSPVSNESVKGSPVKHKNQETSGSTCLEAGTSQHSLSHSSSQEDSGLSLDDCSEDSPHTAVEKKGYSSEDLKKLWDKCMKSNSFHPSPEEFKAIQHDYKVQLERDVEVKDREIEEKDREMEEKDHEIEETKREVEETKREVEETKREVEEKDQQMEETRQEMEETRQEMEEALEISMRVVEETTQDVTNSQQVIQQKDQALQQKDEALQQKDEALQQKDEALQQKDRMLSQKDILLQQERLRVRELEWSLELELQRRLEALEEEIRRLSAQSDRAKCKICLVQEVQVSFIPCNHLISCQGCVDRLPERVCPICREDIEGTVNMLLA